MTSGFELFYWLIDVFAFHGNLIDGWIVIIFAIGEKSDRGDAGMDPSTYGSPTPKYGYHGLFTLELALTIAVGTVLVVALLVCYVYVFRQLCCPPPRHRRHGRRGKPAGDALNPGQTARSNTRHESLPMTNITSQPTETERL